MPDHSMPARPMPARPMPGHTVLDRLWDLIRRRPWLSLAVLTALQTAFTLQSRALWFSDEVRYADAYAGLLRGRWLVLS